MIQRLSIAENTEVSTVRKFSSRLRESAEKWQGQLEPSASDKFSADAQLWMHNLESVLGEASFLGYGKLARLCRSAHLCLTEIAASKASFSKPAIVALARALSAVIDQIRFPDTGGIPDFRVHLDDLRDAYKLADLDYLAPVQPPVQCTVDSIPTSDSGHAVVTPQHSDIEVYRNSWIDALDKCTQEESWIASQLATLAEDLACGTRSERPAARLMSVMRRHKFFHQVDRICLAGRVNLSNQLVVVDASLSERCPENTLRKGYSCFVNPNGSLFKMKPGTLRIFGDSGHVLNSFAQQHQPAQRSIALISEQGLRSGLCIAIGRGDEIQGFLFLNSMRPDLFTDITQGYAPLLSLFALVATIAFDANGFSLDCGAQQLLYGDVLPNHSQKYQHDQFVGFIQSALRCHNNRKTIICLSESQENLQFLYLPTTIAGTVAELLDRLSGLPQFNSTQVEINLSREGTTMKLSLRHQQQVDDEWTRDWFGKIVGIANARLRNRPISVEATDSSMNVLFPYEPILPGFERLLYSVVY